MNRRLAAVPDRPGRAVVYRRVSALMGRGGDDFHSPDLQLAAVRRHLGPLGLREVAVVDDIDVTGRTFARDGLDQIRALVEAGKVDVIAVYDLSRLGRNAGEALRFIKWLRDHNVGIISAVEKIDDTPEGQFILGQFLLLAEMYSNQLGRRWSELITHRARSGKAHGPVPVGYIRTDQGAVPDPVLGPVIADVFHRYAIGEPASQLCRLLTAARGQPTRIQAVKRVLTNPFYRGQVALWGGRTRNSTTKPTFVTAGEHEALVDQATWDRVQDRVRRESYVPKRTLAVSHELVSLGFCGACGGRTQYRETSERAGRVGRLRCGAQTARAGCGGCGTPRLDGVLAIVLQRLAERTRALREDPDAVLLVDAERTRAAGNAEVLRRELGETRRAATRLADGWARGAVPDDAYRTLSGRYADQEIELQRRIDDLERVGGRPNPVQYTTLLEKLQALWPEMSAEQRNRALKDVVRRVVIRKPTRWREPLDGLVDVEFE